MLAASASLCAIAIDALQAVMVESMSGGLTILVSFCPGLGHLCLGRAGKGVAILAITVILHSSIWQRPWWRAPAL